MATTSSSKWSPPKNTRFRRRTLYVRHLLLSAFVVRRGPRLCSLGEKSTGCSWTFCPEGLGPESVIYSGGVGKDITFEHELVKQFGCVVHLLDPSPTGLETMKLPENQIPPLRFFPLGLAGRCGTLRFAPPFYPEEGSWFSNNDAGGIEAECVDVATLLKRNRHDHIDLLKLDIEGAEYDVIDHLLNARVPVRQILVEFHHGLLPGIRMRQGIRATAKLMARGYKMIAEESNNYTFLR